MVEQLITKFYTEKVPSYKGSVHKLCYCSGVLNVVMLEKSPNLTNLAAKRKEVNLKSRIF